MKHFSGNNKLDFAIAVAIGLIALCDEFVEAAKPNSKRKYMSPDQLNFFKSSVYEDAMLKTPGLIAKYKYPVEVHDVVTEDGYILEVHRIPNPGKIPVFVQHGFASSSAEMVFYGPKGGLGFFLYDRGYDVWLGNQRGNRYSKRHVSLNETDPEYWNFSLNELGTYDLKASFDYIMNATKFQKIHFIGNSQGGTVIFIFFDSYPEYSSKFYGINAIVPAVYIKSSNSPVALIIYSLMVEYESVLPMFGGRVLQNVVDMGLGSVAAYLTHDGVATQSIFFYLLSLFFGFNMKETNRTMLPIFATHFPAGASMTQMRHWKQSYETGEFKNFDYGVKGNMKVYGQKKPPFYDIKKCQTKVNVYHSSNDPIVVRKDVDRLYKQLAKPNKKILYDRYNFNHINFVAAENSYDFYNNVLIKSMKELENDL